MTIETDLVTQLHSHAGLTSLISTRTYPVKFPQNVTLPAVVFTRISNNVQVTLDDQELENPRYQFDVISSSYAATRAIVVQVKAAMNAATTYQSILLSDNDLNYETDLELFRSVIDFSVWQQ